MTKADKYLNEEADKKQFAEELTKRISKFHDCKSYSEEIEEEIMDFLDEEIKKTPTYEEKVILKNIDPDFKTISRSNGRLVLFSKPEYNRMGWIKGGFDFSIYNHLFTFIEEQESYDIETLIKEAEYVDF